MILTKSEDKFFFLFYNNYFRLYSYIDGHYTLHLCINNTHISVIVARNSCANKTENLWNSGCIKFSGKNSGGKSTGNSNYPEFKSFRFYKSQQPTNINSRKPAKKRGPVSFSLGKEVKKSIQESSPSY